MPNKEDMNAETGTVIKASISNVKVDPLTDNEVRVNAVGVDCPGRSGSAMAIIGELNNTINKLKTKRTKANLKKIAACRAAINAIKREYEWYYNRHSVYVVLKLESNTPNYSKDRRTPEDKEKEADDMGKLISTKFNELRYSLKLSNIKVVDAVHAHHCMRSKLLRMRRPYNSLADLYPKGGDFREKGDMLYTGGRW